MRSQNKARKLTGSGVLSAAGLLLAALCISVLSYLAGVHTAGRLQSTPRVNAHSTAGDTAERAPVWHGSSNPVQATSTAGLNGNNSRAQTGRHIMLDYFNIPGHAFPAVADTKVLLRIVSQLVQESRMHLMGHSCHVFENTQGITCVFLLSESHLSIHTWPELGFAAVDIYTCGKHSQPEVMEKGLAQLLSPGLTLRQEQARGVLNLANLTKEQKQAKVLHNMQINDEDGSGDGMRQMLFQVPILYTYKSPYQLIQVVEAHGQMGRCLLLNNIIQFCAHDLDAYTDHMARQPLQMLQRLHAIGCTSPAEARSSPTWSTTAAANQQRRVIQAGYGAVTASYPIAASNPIPEHVTCRAHLLQPLGALINPADNSTAALGCRQHQEKARVLIVGGGDGWIAKQLMECYEGWVSSVQLVELDRAVSEVTQKFFGKGGAGSGSSSSSIVNPFHHPNIHWEYTDAVAWVQQRAKQCGAASQDVNDNVSHGYAHNDHLGNAGESSTTAVAKRNRRGLAPSTQATAFDSSSSFASVSTSLEGSSVDSSSGKPGCMAFDVIIIDSTDFTQKVSSQLVSTAFYKALHQLTRPKAALIQLVEIHMREFEQNFTAIEAAMGAANWIGAGRSSVYTPSYGGETMFLQAVKV